MRSWHTCLEHGAEALRSVSDLRNVCRTRRHPRPSSSSPNRRKTKTSRTQSSCGRYLRYQQRHPGSFSAEASSGHLYLLPVEHLWPPCSLCSFARTLGARTRVSTCSGSRTATACRVRGCVAMLQCKLHPEPACPLLARQETYTAVVPPECMVYMARLAAVVFTSLACDLQSEEENTQGNGNLHCN